MIPAPGLWTPQVSGRPRSLHAPGLCTPRVSARPRSLHAPGLCTPQVSARMLRWAGQSCSRCSIVVEDVRHGAHCRLTDTELGEHAMSGLLRDKWFWL